MRFLIFSVLIMVQWQVVFAQQKPTVKKANTAAKTPATVNKALASGREIAITLTPLKNCTVYLGSYFGKGMTLVDSTRLDQNSKGVFKGPNKLTTGIYFVVSPTYTIQFELLMDPQQRFSIQADTSAKESAIITGSPDNDLFKNYALFSNEKGKALQQLKLALQSTTGADAEKIRQSIVNTEKEIKQYQTNILKKHPNALLTALFYIMQRPELPAVPIIMGNQIRFIRTNT